MKIDIHTHTKKCKSGDAHTRAITPKDFHETILSTEVRIVAITNHNVFDYQQFAEICSLIGTDAQVWPGVELDILDGGSRAHLLVMVCPSKAIEFSAIVDQLTRGSTPDLFTSTIEDVLKAFDELGPLYVAHYRQKKPDLSDGAIQKLIDGTANPPRVIKEVSNAISAGIYISHGHASIYGSDVHNWATYAEKSSELPDLRLPVESFEHFCLLLHKDPNTINTALNQKTHEDLTLTPFGDSSTLNIRVFNDINVVFGPKGTGKSCILKAIARHYKSNGIDVSVYESASDKLDKIFNIKGEGLSLNLSTFKIDYCQNEIDALRNARESDITSILKYVAHLQAQQTNKNAKSILITSIEREEESTPKRLFDEFFNAKEVTDDFRQFFQESKATRDVLAPDELELLGGLLGTLSERLFGRIETTYAHWKEICLLNTAIELFRNEVGRKTGTPTKPTTTGFRDYALNRIAIEINVTKILANIDMQIPVQSEIVGSLGKDKGQLTFQTEYKFQNGNITDGSLLPLGAINKTPQKLFVTELRRVFKRVYSDDLFASIAALNAIEEVDKIPTILELVLFKRYFALNGAPYAPSSGEGSMVMLQKELETEKDVYILDEPERSLGNEYISDVIVPLIKERAKLGKKIFISTHDANIAVRTLPYSSIYRTYNHLGYTTYIGNPFSNHLINSIDANDRRDWKTVSMTTLEGGKEAFGERGTIYGNS